MRSTTLVLCLLLLVLPLAAQQTVAPRESPPKVTPFAQVETHRIRIVNAADGAVQVSTDQGKTWRLVGRVTAPATTSVMGYLASGYAAPSTVAAVAVHGLRIRVGELSSAYPKMVSILPREFAQTPKLFGGHVSGASGIYTNIPTGHAIFRALSPYVGNRVSLQKSDDTLLPLPINYTPRIDDVLLIVVKRPANPLRQVVFENRAGGQVTAVYADGTKHMITTVIKPVYGVGRFDGTSYNGVGSLNTNHTGVITVATAPISTSKLFEGDGPERRGGFQIQPAFHNSQSDEAGAAQVLIIGSPAKKRVPELEGTPPLFLGYFDLAWSPKDPQHSWRAEVQRADTGARWLPIPRAIGNLPNALRGIRAIRLIRENDGDNRWLNQRVAADSQAYLQTQLPLARAGKIPVERGQVTISASITDPRTKLVLFYVDGEFAGLTNNSPYRFTWNTTDAPDGEYVVEARAVDENNAPLSIKRTEYWVDNAHEIKRG